MHTVRRGGEPASGSMANDARECRGPLVMRALILSDIHANIDALDAVMAAAPLVVTSSGTWATSSATTPLPRPSLDQSHA